MPTEVSIEMVNRQAQHCRPTVDTSPWIRNCSHILEEPTHLCQIQSLIGFHRPATRAHESDMVAQGGDCIEFARSSWGGREYDPDILETRL